MIRTEASQIALLVDGDNLTGQSWSTLLDKAKDFGLLAVARLYTDFQNLNDGGMAARSAGFELVHVLGKRTSSGYKSMVDVTLATDGMTILYENPNITALVIGTGDADFLPLIRQWKRRGKWVVVMSNEAKLSSELRLVADGGVRFAGAKKRRAGAAARALQIPREKLKEAVLAAVGSTRLTDRETNQPLVRVDWVYEAIIKEHPQWEASLPSEDAVLEIVAQMPELVPIDNKARTYLVGDMRMAPPQPTLDEESEAGFDGPPKPQMSDDAVLELFGELCREVLPSDGTWVAAPMVLNEGKRLLEDGAGLSLPASRPTGWFRSLLQRTPGVLLRVNERGHMEIRRGEHA
jgi:uncharacterized protein (TIGR00288 family)